MDGMLRIENLLAESIGAAFIIFVVALRAYLYYADYRQSQRGDVEEPSTIQTLFRTPEPSEPQQPSDIQSLFSHDDSN